ncbi:MAG: hypothetical protein AAGF54_20595, partial [Pseudomonadota bacterium]
MPTTSIVNPFIVNTSTTDSQFGGQATRLADGNYVVTWIDDNEAGFSRYSDIRAQIFTPDGTPVGSEFIVHDESFGEQTGPLITALSDGGFVISWTDDEGLDGAWAGGFARAFDADGTPRA